MGPWASFGGCQEQWVCLAVFVPCRPCQHQQWPTSSQKWAGSMSIGSSGGSPGGGYLSGGTPATEELAVVSVEEAMAA